MNNQLQQKTDAGDGRAYPAGARSVTADIERVTENMAVLETFVDRLLHPTRRVYGAGRRSTK